MYSLGRTILLPEAYERLVREGAPAAGPGSEEDPFVLEPIKVEVDRYTGKQYLGSGLAVLVLAALSFFAASRV